MSRIKISTVVEVCAAAAAVVVAVYDHSRHNNHHVAFVVTAQQYRVSWEAGHNNRPVVHRHNRPDNNHPLGQNDDAVVAGYIPVHMLVGNHDCGVWAGHRIHDIFSSNGQEWLTVQVSYLR